MIIMPSMLIAKEMTELLEKAQEALESEAFQKRRYGGSSAFIERVTIGTGYQRKIWMTVNFKNDKQEIYCYSEENNCFEYVKTIDLTE